MSGSGPITWSTPLRLALRFGLPLAGVVTVGDWIVASIRGNVSRPGFALGGLLIAASFTQGSVPYGR